MCVSVCISTDSNCRRYTHKIKRNKNHWCFASQFYLCFSSSFVRMSQLRVCVCVSVENGINYNANLNACHFFFRSCISLSLLPQPPLQQPQPPFSTPVFSYCLRAQSQTEISCYTYWHTTTTSEACTDRIQTVCIWIIIVWYIVPITWIADNYKIDISFDI